MHLMIGTNLVVTNEILILDVWFLIFCAMALCLCYGCRGIDVVRNKIKMFAQKKVTLPPGRHKVVILDEADRFVVLKVGIFILVSAFYAVKLFFYLIHCAGL